MRYERKKGIISDGNVTITTVKTVNNTSPDSNGNVNISIPVTSVNGATGAVSLFTSGTSDLTAGSSSLETGKLYFVYE